MTRFRSNGLKLASLLLLVFFGSVAGSRAQQPDPMPNRWGPIAGLDADHQTVLVGVEGRFENRSVLDGIPLQFRPGAHVIVLASGVVVSADANVHYRIPIEDNDTGLTPYAGGGVSVRYRSAGALPASGTDFGIGINVIGGSTYETEGRGTPFLELRSTLSDRGTVALIGGLLFEL